MDWARFGLTVALVALIVALAFGLRAGWRHRVARQSAFAPLPAAPLPGSAAAVLPGGTLPGVYVATTTSGDWQDRIVAQGAGRRAAGALELRSDGILIDRIAEEAIWIPLDLVTAVTTAPGIAGKVMGIADGIVVITWRWSGVQVDTGFRADDRSQQADWIAAAATLLAASPNGGPVDVEVPE